MSWGEIVGIYLVAKSTQETEVTVRNVRRLAVNITATDFTRKIHAAMPAHLTTIAASGALVDDNPLPAGGIPKSPNPAPSLISTPAPEPPAIVSVNGLGGFHALIIGNDSYKGLPKLKTAVSDAKAISATLKRQYGFKVELLLDADRAEILRALRKCRELPATDNLLIYYAGHGWIDKDADEGYWLPVDAEQEDSANWIPNSTITAEIRALQTKHVMVIADSCYSGKLTRGVKLPQRTPNYYQRMAARKARVVLSSGGIEPVADDGGSSR
jgi:hypothetical protein